MTFPSMKAIVWTMAVVPALVLVVVVNSLALYGNHLFPGEPVPEIAAAEPAVLALWLDAGGRDPLPPHRKGPVEAMAPLHPLFGRTFEPDPVERMAIRVAQTQVARSDRDLSPRQQHLAMLVGTISVLWQWTPAEMAAYLAPRVSFGPDDGQQDGDGDDIHGFDAAAVAFFERSVDTLTDAQLLVLAAIQRSPTRFDPWCEFDFLARFIRHEYGVDLGPAAELELRSQPHACGQ